MNKREMRVQRNQENNLDLSEDEIMLSVWMKKSQEGDSESYRLLLQKVKELMTPVIANSLTKFGLASAGGQEDVMQEILLGIHLKRATFDPEKYFLPWMHAIAKYKAIDYLRRNKFVFQMDSLDENFLEPEQSTDLSNLDIESLCEKLSIKQRQLLLLVKVNGLTINEAAAKTGFSASDVKITLFRALKELKTQVSTQVNIQIKNDGYEN